MGIGQEFFKLKVMSSQMSGPWIILKWTSSNMMAKPQSGSGQSQLGSFKNILINFWVLYKVENVVSNWETVSFSRKNLFHGVRSLVNYGMTNT